LRRRGDHQLGHAHEIGGGDDVLALGVRALNAAVTALAEAAGRLRPTKDLFNALAQLLTDRMREGDVAAGRTPGASSSKPRAKIPKPRRSP
jgi:hypothetical protein